MAVRVVREHTFKLILSAVGIAAAAIYLREASHPASARLSRMHTRVYGQGVALVTTIALVLYSASAKERWRGILRKTQRSRLSVKSVDMTTQN
eukprot:scaffold31509_cov71-Phaeocystis_antarctica.AAC.3